MGPCGTPARIISQNEHWPFKITIDFLLIKKSISTLTKSWAYTVFTQFAIQCSIPDIIKGFLRYQEIILEHQGLYWKH